MFDLASFDSLAPILRDDPYSVYAAMREQAPVFWSDTEQAWVLLGHREVTEAFANSRLLTLDFNQFVGDVTRAFGDTPVELLRFLDVALFLYNPPEHGVLRSFVARLVAFRPQAGCAAVVESIANRLIAPLIRDGAIDLMSDYADPLPPLFMGWLYGLSDNDAEWLADTLTGVPTILNRGCSIRDYRSANTRLEKANAFLRDQIAERRRKPKEDGLSLMVSLNADAERPLDDNHLAALASFVFVSGFENTSALIGNGLWLLLRHPEHYDRLAANPALISGAVEEALRLEPPIQQTRRRAQDDQIIADCPIKAGQHIILMIAAANRDPRAYPDPDRFLPERAGPPVLSFGGGAHHCLGGWIARMEANIAMSTVLKGPCPRVDLEKPDWRPNHNQRRMRNLPVRF